MEFDSWKEDTDLKGDFIKAFQEDPANKGKTIEDAKKHTIVCLRIYIEKKESYRVGENR